MKITIRHRESSIIRCVKLYAQKFMNVDEYEFFSHDGTDHEINLAYDIQPDIPVYLDYNNNKIELLLKSRNEYIKVGGFIDNYKELSVTGDNADTFVKDAVNNFETMYITKLRDDKLNVLQFRYGHVWEIESYCTKRSMDTVYIPRKVKENIVEDINKFINNKERYETLDIPYSRIYMLYGPPGTGKTTLIKSLASKFNKNVAILDFDKDMNDKDMKYAFKNMPKNSVVLLEDIDCLFESRKACDEFKNDVSFSAILNTLDGICENNGLIMFITTNHLDKLDAALVRRIDYFIKFDYASKEQIKGIYSKFFPAQMENFDQFYSQIKNVKVTINVIQKFFTRHLDSVILDKTSELCEFATGELCLDNLNNNRLYT